MIEWIVKSDDFLFHRHLKKRIDQLMPKGDRDFNFDRLSAKSGLSKIIELYKTMPMMAPARLVVVEDFDALDKDDLEVLLKNLSTPLPDSHLILISEKIDKRTSFYKTLSRTAQIVEFKKLYPNQIPEFVVLEAKNLDLTINLNAANLLIQAIGTDLMLLVQELEKLKLALLPKNKIDESDIEKFVASGILINVFEFTETLAQKNLKKSYALFQRFYQQGEPLVRLISLVVSHFKKIILVKEAKTFKEKEPLEVILGLPAFIAKNYIREAEKFTLPELYKIYKNLMILSEKARQNGLSTETEFVHFFQTLCLGSTVSQNRNQRVPN